MLDLFIPWEDFDPAIKAALNKSACFRLMRRGKFVTPLKTSPGATPLFPQSRVRAWWAERLAEAGINQNNVPTQEEYRDGEPPEIVR